MHLVILKNFNLVILKNFGLARTKFSVFSKNFVIEVAYIRIIRGLACTNFSDYANHR